jgi:hypothetical protein
MNFANPALLGFLALGLIPIVIYLINHQFLDGNAPGSPWPSCGADPAGEAGIGCEIYSHCP